MGQFFWSSPDRRADALHRTR